MSAAELRGDRAGAAARLARYRDLRRGGADRIGAARELGIGIRTADRYERRLRAADPGWFEQADVRRLADGGRS